MLVLISNLLAHDCFVGVLVDELVLAVGERAAGELQGAGAPRHVRHAELRPELGVGAGGVRLRAAAPAARRAVPLAAETARELEKEHGNYVTNNVPAVEN